jgi:hypothetical protein
VVIWLSTVLSGVVALIGILGWVTERGKCIRRWVRNRIGRRPVARRTNVHLEPQGPANCWAQVDAPTGSPTKHVTFQLSCVATNLTPSYDVRIVGVRLRGVSGNPVWDAVTSWGPGGHTVGAELPPDRPVDVMLIVTLERGPLPPGPHVGRMVIRDHLGQQHRTTKVKFADVNQPSTPPQPVSTDGSSSSSGA